MSDHAQPSSYSLVTWTLFAINVLVYLAQVATGVNWLEPSTDAMISWGGNLAAYSLVDQPWRLLTSMFLHVGLVHLALNMYMLLIFGMLVERRFGRVRMLLAYLLSGIVGSLVSALWHADPMRQVIGAGASGALMGLCGAYLADWLVAQWHNDPHESISTGGPLVQTIGINLVIGAFMPGIDNACHVGGLIGGFIVGGAFAMIPLGFGRLQRALAVAVISGLALGAIYAKLNGKPPEGLLMIRQLQAAEQEELDAKANAKRAQAAFAADIAKEIAEDRRRGPRAVNKEQAAGTSIALAESVSSLTLMPDNRLAVAGEDDHTLRLLDLNAGADAAGSVIKGQPAGSSKVPCGSHRCTTDRTNAMAFTPDGRSAYVASMIANGVGVVDLQTQKMTASFKTGKSPRAVVLNKSADRAYVLNDGDDTVVAVDLATRKIIGKPAVIGTNIRNSYHPTGIWLADNDKELWVMDESASRLLVLDAATLAEVSEVIVTSGYMNGAHVDPQHGKVVLVGVDAIDLIDMKSKKIEKTARYCGGVLGAPVAINHDGKLMAIAEPHGWVRIVNLRTATTIAAYPFDGTPAGLRFAPDGKRLYFIANESPRLTVFDTSVTVPLNQVVNKDAFELLCTPLR